MSFFIVMVNPWSTDEPEAVVGPFETEEGARAARRSELGQRLWDRDAICSAAVRCFPSLEAYEEHFRYVTEDGNVKG